MVIDVTIDAAVTTTEVTAVVVMIDVTTDMMIVGVDMTGEMIEDTAMTEGMIGRDMDGATIREGEGIET